ncbi:MAG TPA: HAMP domain-containing sensor histidine kinase [Elusimicrobiales bacterium]|nr:HAMP domain-containing sensor histidine kinase [Elusimicrobiales bacterium]
MAKYLRALDRGEVTNFSRNSYEVIFSIFMIALAYFYRSSPQISYPRILYFFLLLLGSNFIFNYLLRRRTSINLWLVDLILLVNLWIITGVLYCSGGGDSYFWVLYLLPVFAASLMSSFKDAFGVVFLCVLAITYLSWPLGGAEMAQLLSLAVKIGVLGFSAGVVYNTAQSKKLAEAGLAAKRGEIEQLSREITLKEGELVKTASFGEVGTMASGVMHDLGNAVSVILLSAEIAAETDKPEPEDMQRIIKAAKLAKEVISGVMGIARGEDYVFRTEALTGPVRNAILLTDCAARKKYAAVELDLPDTLPQLLMSRVHLERLFINTISNSLSFVPEHGTVKLSARAVEGGVRLTIADNGPGFPAQLLRDGIKALATTRKAEGGTGLGLFVCEQIVHHHGGEMTLDNPPEGGARITVFLPLEGPPAKAQVTSSTSTVSPSPAAPGTPGTV